MNNGFSPSRRAWNRVMTVLVWASAVLVMVLVAGIIGMVLVRGIPHISWKFLSTTASVLKKTDGILPAILNTLYVIVLTLLIVLPLGVGAAVFNRDTGSLPAVLLPALPALPWAAQRPAGDRGCPASAT